MASSNQIQKEKRIQRVIQLVGEGKFSHQIVTILSNEWKCSGRNVYKYITIVRDMVRKELNKQDIVDAAMRYDYLYQMAMDSKNYKLAAQIESYKNKLTIGEKTQVEHSGSISGININLIDGIKPPSE